MLRHRWLAGIALVLGIVTPQRSDALTAGQFMEACRSSDRPCAENPWLQAYVGGALDFVAVLQEETDFTRQIYCKDPRLLFDVTAIIDFVEKNHEAYRDKNAMMLVVKFLEVHGGC